MMRFLPLFLLLSPSIFSQNIENYRKNYSLAVKNKSICEAMINDLKNHSKTSLYKAYLGAYQTIWANHVINPINKLNTFQKGKRNLEASIKEDPKNIEMKYLRYTIQKNAPKFLGYHQDLEHDRIFILTNKRYVKDEKLKEFLNTIN